ncbi:MAG: DNA-directed RNA polymerase subunit alpha [Bacilli bacterium]|jgi:DNA-directed RNA polymerase subunit alpha|nr:DNA-directed RNA polymerase subunit alpha [Bacilli bacterium]MCH4202349.1 DNA-directed RNA polymerase subunit alpha [Bacilli bacterium]MCH4235487.1 DNA-directed RNA polymerase subunit alpha [Bacilli bacterium]
MSKIAHPFEKPEFKVATFDDTTNYGKFVIEPLERGFGLTIGNSLRRVLLSSLPGASVYAVEIEGARHEFAALEGIVEDVTTIILNLKDLVLKIDDEENVNKRLEIDVMGPTTVRAGDIKVPGGVTIVNPDLEIAHIAEGGHLKMIMHAHNGRGYVTSEGNKALHPTLPVGAIATDSNYSPITKVSYTVDGTRVGHDTNFDRLTLEVTTNGAMRPQDAVALSARILMAYFDEFASLDEKTKDINILKDPVEEEGNKFENMTIEELDLSVRSYNCLKRAGIQTVLELTQKSEEEMMKVRNLGKKSLKEVKDKLAEIGLSFRDFE